VFRLDDKKETVCCKCFLNMKAVELVSCRSMCLLGVDG